MQTHFVRRASPAIFALNRPKPLLGSFTSSKRSSLQEGPLRRPVKTTRVLIAVGGPAPTAPGANSVASALGSLTRRDPGKAVRTYHVDLDGTLKIGSFYFAGNRNFLLCSDRLKVSMKLASDSVTP
jgi:hypothetical protein